MATKSWAILALLLSVWSVSTSLAMGVDVEGAELFEAEDFVQIPLRRREVSRRRMQSDGYRTVGFTKREADGVYWASIRIGTPPQTFSVIVDTGSSTIAVPCTSCNDCGRHNKFDPQMSSTIERTGQRYSQCYSEGSCNTGEYMTDLACFGDQCQSNETVRHRFGCADNYAKAFKNQEADGIVGLSGSPDTLIANLRQQYKFRKNMFALCFGRNGGSLTVGGVYHRPWREDPIYIPLASSTMFYSVRVTEVAVGDAKIAVGNLPSLPIIDSGSTFTYLPSAIHAKVVEEFNKFCQGSGRCRGTKNPPGTPAEDIRDSVACYSPPNDVTDVDKWFLSDFPTISFWFDNKKWCIPPPTYFFLSKQDIRSFCIGVLRDQKFVIGAVTMSDFTVIFDHDNNQIGIARSDCDGNRDVSCCSKTCPGSSFKPPMAATLAPTPPTTFDPDSEGPMSTRAPTIAYVPSFWQTNVRVVSGLFFFLGIFFACFCACFVWLCCPTTASIGGSSSIGGNGIPRRGDFQKISPSADDDTEALAQQ